MTLTDAETKLVEWATSRELTMRVAVASSARHARRLAENDPRFLDLAAQAWARSNGDALVTAVERVTSGAIHPLDADTALMGLLVALLRCTPHRITHDLLQRIVDAGPYSRALTNSIPTATIRSETPSGAETWHFATEIEIGYVAYSSGSLTVTGKAA